MCGIFLSLSHNHFVIPTPEQLRLLQRRGPDSRRTVQRKIRGDSDDSTCYLSVTATVLSLRGNHTVKQPIEDDGSESLLCWNGEAWTVDGDKVGGNDAQIVFDRILKATQSLPTRGWEVSNKKALERSLTTALSAVTGPFAFLYYDSTHQQLWFGRDVLGRRSLLKTVREDGSLIISSAPSETPFSTWCDIEADGIYNIDLAPMSKRAEMLDDNDFHGKRIAYKVDCCPWSAGESVHLSTAYPVYSSCELQTDGLANFLGEFTV